MSKIVPLENRESVTVQEAHAYTGISEASLYGALADGTLEGTTVRGRKIIYAKSLLRLLYGDRGTAPDDQRAA